MTVPHYLRLGLLVLLGCGAGYAQEPACGIHSVLETVAPIYMPLAKAAHVTGDVMLLATFDHDGSVSEVQVIRGPVMLQASAVDFVKGWKANAYGGSRNCPVSVHYELAYSGCAAGESDHRLPNGIESKRIDSQHYTVAAQGMTLCDSAADFRRRRRFLGIF